MLAYADKKQTILNQSQDVTGLKISKAVVIKREKDLKIS